MYAASSWAGTTTSKTRCGAAEGGGDPRRESMVRTERYALAATNGNELSEIRRSAAFKRGVPSGECSSHAAGTTNLAEHHQADFPLDLRALHDAAGEKIDPHGCGEG